MAGRAAAANMSMILTPPARLTDPRPGEEPQQPARLRSKASHNGHCVTLEPRPRYNMSHQSRWRRRWHGHCLYNTRRGRNGLKGGRQEARDSKKAWVRVSRMAQPDTVSLNNNDKTLLHTQASDRTPRQKRGGFFCTSISAGMASGAPFQRSSVGCYPHFESPQLRQVMQPSIITTAAVEHLAHSCAPSGKWDFENASVCLARASNSAR